MTKEVKDFTVKVHKFFIDLLTVISDYDLKFSVKEESPIYILLEDKKFKFEFIVAPLKPSNAPKGELTQAMR